MNHDQETYELIEQYLEGRLAGQALLDFEQTMREDASLTKEVELQREVQALLVEEDINSLDRQLTDIRKDYGPEVPKLLPFRKIWFAAAAVLVLAIISIGFFTKADPIDGEQLYVSYFEPYPADNSVRSTEDDPTLISQMERALEAYANEDFKAAVQELLGYLYVDEDNSRARFYLGISLLAQGYAEKAAESLLEVAEESDSIYADPARWYYALSLIRQSKRSSARKELKRLEKDAKGKYQKLAIEMLDEL
ncbi:MAG: hypothetical protein HEP71_13705 [Roseivirga sp.]|nr:hypothetical protein [Roseivirga sp.]